jgi:hypothetical protein
MATGTRLPLDEPEAERSATVPQRVDELELPFARSGSSKGEDVWAETVEKTSPASLEADNDIDIRARDTAPYSDAGNSPATFSSEVVEPTPELRSSAAQPVVDRPLFGHASIESVDRSDQAAERPRSAMSRVAAALVVGIGLGFLGGYTIGVRQAGRVDAVQSKSDASDQMKAASPDAAATKSNESPGSSTGATDAARVGSVAPPAGGLPPPSKVDAAPSVTSARPDAPARGSSAPSQREAAASAKGATTGRLLVRSSPGGARVYVDGELRGSTPIAIRDLALGSHRVQVTLDGYVPENQRIDITTAHLAQSLIVDLERPRAASPPGDRVSPSAAAPAAATTAGVLVIESRPAGAAVFLDGASRGKTPLVIGEVGIGQHTIRLEHDGYRHWTGSVRVATGVRHRITASLER